MPDRHPIMAAVEGPTGTWKMVAPDGVEYGTIEIRRVMNGTDVRYRCTRRDDVLGWATTLREACMRLHNEYLRAHGPGGGPAADWRRDDRSWPAAQLSRARSQRPG